MPHDFIRLSTHATIEGEPISSVAAIQPSSLMTGIGIGSLPQLPPLPVDFASMDDNDMNGSPTVTPLSASPPPPQSSSSSSSASIFASLMPPTRTETLSLASAGSNPSWLSAMGNTMMSIPTPSSMITPSPYAQMFSSLPPLPSLPDHITASPSMSSLSLSIPPIDSGQPSGGGMMMGMFGESLPLPAHLDDGSTVVDDHHPHDRDRDDVNDNCPLSSLLSYQLFTNTILPPSLASVRVSQVATSRHPLDNVMGVGSTSSLPTPSPLASSSNIATIAYEFTRAWLHTKQSWYVPSNLESLHTFPRTMAIRSTPVAAVAEPSSTTPAKASTSSIWQLVNSHNNPLHSHQQLAPTQRTQQWDDHDHDHDHGQPSSLQWWQRPNANSIIQREPLTYLTEASHDAFTSVQHHHLSHSLQPHVEV
jgi:hypothetical protein